MPRRAFLLAGIAALSAVPGHASVSGFRLPPSSTATPTPSAQGPVDPEVPAERPRPATSPAPTPAPPATPRASATPTATPVIQPLAPTPTPTARAAQDRASPAARPAPSPTPSAVAAPTPAPASAPTAGSPALPAAAPSPGPARSAPPTATGEDEDGWPWGWIGALAALLAAGAGAASWLRRRAGRPRGTVLIVPEIEKPRVPPKPAPPEAEPAGLPEPSFAIPAGAQPEPAAGAETPAPAEAAEAGHPLHILIEPLKLTQTMMNMTLSYRLELSNRGPAALDDLVVAADLVGAHASLPREAQLAGPDSALHEVHRVASLAPDETVELKGELKLALASLVPIRQGSAVIAVPLARFRASSAGEEARCFTVAVGPPSPGGAIQPHRLDLGLRSVAGLTGRAF